MSPQARNVGFRSESFKLRREQPAKSLGTRLDGWVEIWGVPTGNQGFRSD